jgi:hypothetical protein
MCKPISFVVQTVDCCGDTQYDVQRALVVLPVQFPPPLKLHVLWARVAPASQLLITSHDPLDAR